MNLRIKNCTRKGQMSTYLKPMVLIILSILFIVMVVINLNFISNVQEQRETFELRSQVPKIKDNIVSCLLVSQNESKSEILIDREKLKRFDEFYKFKEPECMEDFVYGWNATVRQEFLTGEQTSVKTQGASIMLIIDGSGSMDTDHDLNFKKKYIEAKEAAQTFVDISRKEDKIGIVQFSGTAKLEQSLTTDKPLLRSVLDNWRLKAGGTSLASGIKESNKELEANGEGKLYEILLTDGCPDHGPGTTGIGRYHDDLKKAKELGITIYTIGFGFGKSNDVGGCPRDVAIGHLDKIAEETGGESFLAEDLEDLKEIYSLIAGELEVKTGEIGLEGSTCTLIPKKGTSGKLDIAFLIDTSGSMVPETACGVIDNLVSELQSEGLKVNHRVYGMPEGPTVEEWKQKYNLTYKTDTLHWSFVQYVRPSCIEEDTEWNEDIVFNPFKDAMPEGWGSGSDYILDNHEWDSFSNKLIIVLGDQDPTGGCQGNAVESALGLTSPEDAEFWENFTTSANLDVNCRDWSPSRYNIDARFANPWRHEPYIELPGDTNGNVNSEIKLMDRIIDKSNNEEVSIFFLHKLEYILERQYEDGNDARNDAIESMERVAGGTNGKVYKFGDWISLSSDLKDQFTDFDVFDSIDTCTNVFYSFGESQGSFSNNLNGKVEFAFPVIIKHNKILTTPGTLFLEVRDGSLERMAGEINKVYELGEKFGTFESIIKVETDSRIEIVDNRFTRPKRTKYILSGGPNPTDNIFVDEDIVIGVDGDSVFREEDGFATNDIDATYKGEPIPFEALTGHSLQVLGFNFKEPSVGIGPLYIHCCGNQIQKFSDRIFADNKTDPELYGNLTKNFNFFFNFTTIEIGEYEEYVEKGICMGDVEKSCVNLRTNAINNFVLEPGEYFVRIKYQNETVEVSK